eukprot:jgi/Bigna1/129596/aug1.9_g4304
MNIISDWCDFLEIDGGTDFRYRQNDLFSSGNFEDLLAESSSSSSPLVNSDGATRHSPPALVQPSFLSSKQEREMAMELLRAMPDGFPLFSGCGAQEAVTESLSKIMDIQAIFSEGTGDKGDTKALKSSDRRQMAKNSTAAAAAAATVCSDGTSSKHPPLLQEIDELYNRRARLVFDSEVGIDALFDGDVNMEEAERAARALDLEKELQFDRMPMRADAPASTSSVTTTPPSKTKTETSENDVKIDVDGSLQLSSKHTLFTGEDERFAFTRAISRLVEMQSPLYFQQRSFNFRLGPDRSVPLSSVATAAVGK